jgi:16S rRNA (cytidine1402-2'-O)-methyltransferase
MTTSTAEPSQNPSTDPPAADEEDARSSTIPPGLVLVATPIGHLGDISPRAVAALRDADLILCEDTRTTARLLQEYGIGVHTEPLHDHNETARTPALVARLQRGARIALVSDAGTPLVSDPGFRLVRAAIEAGVSVSAVPGANAAVMALILSGLPPQPFMFLGFPPPRSAARLAAFATVRAAERAGLSATLLWHEAPHRLAESLADMATVFGPRPAAVARELTKRFEEVRRGALEDLAAHYAAHAARGEITVVVGPPADDAADAEDLDGQLRRALATATVRDAAATVAAATGLPKKTVYARALALSQEQKKPS